MWADHGCEHFCTLADYKILVRSAQNAHPIIYLHENKNLLAYTHVRSNPKFLGHPTTFNPVGKGNIQLSVTERMHV